MTKLFIFHKWRALLAGLLLATIVGFLYTKKTASEIVLLILSVASILHIILFFFLLIKDLKLKNKL